MNFDFVAYIKTTWHFIHCVFWLSFRFPFVIAVYFLRNM